MYRFAWKKQIAGQTFLFIYFFSALFLFPLPIYNVDLCFIEDGIVLKRAEKVKAEVRNLCF